MPHALTRTIKAGLAVVLLFTLFPPVALDAAEQTPGRRNVSDFACPPDEVPDAGFRDTDGNAFEDEIDCLAWYGITRGGPEGRPETQYGPELEVRRDQMASFIARMIDYIDPGAMATYDGQNAFIDVPDDSAHVEAINRLHDVGVVQGGPGGRQADEYGPGLVVRRDAMAGFINRAIRVVSGSALSTSTDYFDDDNTSVHEPDINGLASGGIVEGVSFGVYRPERSVLRDSMSAFIMRAVDMQVEAGDTFPPTAVRLTAIDIDDADANGAMSEGDVVILRFNANMLVGDVVRVTLVDVEGDRVVLATDEQEDDDNDSVTPVTVSGDGTASLSLEIGADVDVKPGGDEVFDNAFDLTEAMGITDTEGRPWVPEEASGDWPGPPPVGDQSYPGSPADEAVLTVGEEREFTFEGVSSVVDVALVPCSEVSVFEGFATFSDDEEPFGHADDVGNTDAYIASVNGVPHTGSDPDYVDKASASGTLTVVIGSDVPACVRPVVFRDSDSAGTGDNRLDVDANGSPTENYGIAGETVWLPFGSASTTDAADGRVGFVDKPTNRIAVDTARTGLGNAGPSDTNVTYVYDENDDFSVDGAPATFNEFHAAISRGDGLTVGNYSAAASGVSVFDISDNGPAVPSVTATAGGAGEKEDTVVVTITPSNPSVVEIYDTFLIERAEVTSDGVGAYKVIANAPVANDDDSDPLTFSYIDSNVPAGNWRYRVSGVIDGDASPTATDDATTQAIGPLSEGADLSDTGSSPGQANDGDVLTLYFDEPVVVGTGTRLWLVEGTDMAQSENEEQFVITCGFSATCELNTSTVRRGTFGASYGPGERLTITLTGRPPEVGNTADADAPFGAYDGTLEWPATAYQSDITDATGAPWDIVASPDKTFG